MSDEFDDGLWVSVVEVQILSYMKLTDKKVGLLINFNSKMVKDGIERFVL